MLLLALGVGAAMGFAEAWAPVTWPPAVALAVCCAALALAAPGAAWLLGLVAGLAAAGTDLLLGAGRPTLLHVGVLGPFGAILPALAAAHVGLWIALVAGQVRARGARR